MKISVIGSGYVGLVSAACFSDFGHQVVAIDNDEEKISQLKKAKSPIYEPGLEEIVKRNLESGNLKFSSDYKSISKSKAILLAVGTPEDEKTGKANLSYLKSAVETLAPLLPEIENDAENDDFINDFKVIITKSTVPIGTGDLIEQWIREINPNANFSVVSNPEFLREGAAINDFKRPDRIIIGVADERSKEVMSEIYRPLYLNQSPLVFMDRKSAECTKYASNAFLAMKITFINEFANLCEKVGANVQDVAHGMGMDKRIGSKFLHAGPGFGGSCFPKDTKAIAHQAVEFGSPLKLVEDVIAINDSRKKEMAYKIEKAMSGCRDKKIAILGLSFKPNTDDIREAPALDIIEHLQSLGAKIIAYDPEGMKNAKKILKDVSFSDSAYDTVRNCDALVITTEWEQFRALNLTKIKTLMKKDAPYLFDLRNIYRKKEVEPIGFKYFSIGRP